MELTDPTRVSKRPSPPESGDGSEGGGSEGGGAGPQGPSRQPRTGSSDRPLRRPNLPGGERRLRRRG